MADYQYGLVIHGRWSDDEEPTATVIYSCDGWIWHDLCVTNPDHAQDIAEALSCMAELRALRDVGDALAEALHGWTNGMDAFTDDAERLRAWQEARRG